MILQLDFIIVGIFIIICLIPLYIYKEKIFNFVYKKNNFKTFIHNIKVYTKDNHPKIKFDFDKIIDDTKDEKNPNTRALLIVENLVWQFINYKYISTTKDPINKELLWSSYIDNSKPIKDKLPSDWSKRKELTWQRDKHQCQRCGFKMRLNDAKVTLLKPIEKGGRYNFENLETLCIDCYKIIKSKDLSKTAKSLNIMDNLIKKIK